ncbi:trimeric autotransporter adhesin [Ulvibacter sp. MAR_2010_11]|uniref:hypothetical protein n=1 Tax=Ulvibacter sp. MAR_2010_11 TaxID=1250229 RepID=UPI000C2CDB83|nr:hypothetical protein [Ulvibacter sp. MAR_2010_11]PKA83209.1 trimeric autotransporter adhesin [Ulvibacter sp. MAR_2010_11]
MKKAFLFISFLLTSFIGLSQVGINNTDPKASLDISANNVATPANTDGILIPRIDNFPLTPPAIDQDGMMVFATGNGTPAKGFYYWDQGTTSWVSVGGGVDTQNTLDEAYDEGGAGSGKNINATDGAIRINGDDGFLVTGTFGSGDLIDTEITGTGTRMFFNPRKAAFRAGYSEDARWDDANIGDYSFAVNRRSMASGFASVSLGYDSEATGDYSFVTGYNSAADGDNSFAFGSYSYTNNSEYAVVFGNQTNARDDYSWAVGYGVNSYGVHSFAKGEGVTSYSYGETVFGFNNTSYTANSATTFNAADRLFVLGNGVGATPSNALIVYKNGSMNINDAYTLPNTDDTAGQVLTTDGAGIVTFQDSAAGVERINDLIDGKSDIDGTNNGSSVFLGISAGAADDSTDNKNVGIGWNAMQNTSTGIENIAIGNRALQTNTSGGGNIAIGHQSLLNNTNADSNVAVGGYSLRDNTTGDENTAIGPVH